MAAYFVSLLVLVAVCLVDRSAGVACYSCNSVNPAQPGCWPFNAEQAERYIIDCGEDTACRKLLQTVDGKDRVSRHCASLDDLREGEDTLNRGRNYVLSRELYCRKDKCNGAMKHSALAGTIVVGLGMGLVLRFW